MSFAFIVGFAGAVLAWAVICGVAYADRRALANRLLIAGLIVLALESVFAALAADAIVPDRMALWQNWQLTAMALLPGTWLFVALTYARGDHARILRQARNVLIAAFLAPLVLVAGFRGELVVAVKGTEHQNWIFGLGWAGIALHILFLISTVLILMNLERTYRAAVGTMRWRIKFMILGLGVLFGVRAYSSSQVLLFRAESMSLQIVNSGALVVACLLILRSLFRAGQFEVHVYPSQSVLHNSLTVLLAGIYLIVVGVLAKVVTILGGDAGFTLKAFFLLVALVLLTMLLLSDRVRLHIQRFVSRHFQRPMHDYRTVWRTFTEGTARRLEPADLCGAVVRLASETFQALAVSIWLVDERKENLTFVASTSLTGSQAEQLGMNKEEAAQVIAAMTLRAEPFDLETAKEPWAEVLRRIQPDQFQKGGNRVCVPMHAGGELLGMMILGDRVGGVLFSLQDFDLLKSVSGQAAASLLNIQLSQRLTQAKQLEAFQAMSAFFVHDLKNTASTLSLTLQNLPVHFNDPQFREDVLRGMSKTVTHINDLIRRLTELRQELMLNPVEADLNDLVVPALTMVGSPSGIELVRDLRPVPKVRVDAQQIQNVITNLVLNAQEAMGASGQIRIETSQRNGWAVLAVADTGCGMSQQFVQHSLFRPFQTTKKKGIGIGMFQCKMIVEAHRGRIEVESQPGQGTIFRVLLPLAA